MRLRLSSDVMKTSSGGRHFVTSLETGDVFELNATAAELVDLIARLVDAGDASLAFADLHPDAPRSEVLVDAEALVARLVDAGILEPV